ncbi:class I SAM-dependent methyltransferase [Patescibacteria group bacterium]|nr:class I SAM-dependent methyltransferase [Patescibacteria group bacterium]MBP9709699.1 class I SAM-dependent methyltransferase [Patescibacteria group bacterium]
MRTPLEQKTHDNSLEMWDGYYSAQKPADGLFSSLIHWGREVYFGNLFAERVIKLGGEARSYLELGVGTAQTLARLQRLTGARCVGIEKTPRAYEMGKLHAPNCEIVLGDGLNLPFADGAFEVVYSLGLFEHFEPEEQVRLLQEQARVANKRVLIEVPARTPHMRFIMWVNRRLLGKRGVWADDELFSPERFMHKFPGLPFEYYFDWASGAMTCWFVIHPKDILAYAGTAR